MMKNTLLSTFLAAAPLVAWVPAAHAADGTISFAGTVTAQTCTISGNGGSKDFTVALPTVSVSALQTGAGTISGNQAIFTAQPAGKTPFSIALSNCSPNTGNVSVYFEPGPAVDTTHYGGVLANTLGTAQVYVKLYNDDDSPINLGAAQASQNSKVVALANGSATLRYAAAYLPWAAYGTGKDTQGNLISAFWFSIVTPGAVNTSVMYSITYQ